MQVGAVFPQTEIGADPGAIREYAQAAEELGYDHIVAYDHVLGADITNRPDWPGPYTYQHMFHEPFVLFAYLAAITRNIGLATSVIILPQRQTALVAKQAAEVDVLSGGRLRLGVGTGWNYVEYEALNENFHNRGRRLEEQVEVLKALWTQDLVTFKGRWHRIIDAGINPLPVQRPIPIWMGGDAEPVQRRIARQADGWFPLATRPDEQGQATIQHLHDLARQAGRHPRDIGIEGRVNAAHRAPERWLEIARAWESVGATHLTFNTMGCGFTSVSQHIAAMRQFKEALGSSS